jgi:hypothetical protein
MGAFDPDAFLAKEEQAPAPTNFDPDAFLAKKEEPKETFDPDAFLGTKPAPAEEAKPKKDAWWQGNVADVPLHTATGLVSGVRMIADAMGADNPLAQKMRGAENWIADLYSAQSKKDSKEVARIMKEAEDKGIADQVLAGVEAMSVAPVDVLSNALGTMAAPIVAGLATTLGGAEAAVATGVSLGLGSLMGAGTIKGSIYDATKQVLQEKTNLSPQEIEDRAVKAQEYGGKNLDQILLGAGLGAFGASTGAEPAIARQLAKGIVSKAAATDAERAVVQTATRKATEQAAERGVLKQAAIKGGEEFLGEAAEGGQEQMAQNIAQQREGFNVPTMQGVVSQGTLEGLAGLGLGSMGGGREAYKAKRELAEEAVQKQGERDKLKGQFTTAKEEPLQTNANLTQEHANLITPALDTKGNPIVGGVETPVVETPAEETKAEVAAEEVKKEKKPKAEKIKPEDVTPESVTTANDYVAKIDGGQPVKQSEYRQVAKSLGLSIPVGTKNADGVEMIRKHLAERGAQNVAGTVNGPTGVSTQLSTPPAANVPAGGTAETQRNGVVPTGENVGPAITGEEQQPAAVEKPKTIEDLSPEMQQEVARRRDEIAEIEADGGDASKQKKFLNAFLQKQGVTGTLAHKSIEKDFLETGELPYATAGEEKTEQQVEKERVAEYEKSLGKSIPDYEISEEDKRLYNETRDEVNSQVDEANARRRELVEAVDKAASNFENAEEGEAEDKAWEHLIAAEKALKDHGEEQHKLPEYVKHFSPDYKDVYFSNITSGPVKNGKLTFGSSKREHRNAAKALQAYMRKMGGKNKEQLSPQERRIVNHYEENRTDFQKLFGITFPAWNKLTPDQKYTFAQEMINNSGQQQNVAFAKLGVKLIEDSRELSEGEKREKQNIIDRQEQVRQESEAQQERDRKTREAYNRNAPPTTSLPNSVVQMVMNNDLQGILEYMSSVKTSAFTSPYKRIMKSVAQSLRDMKLNTKIKIVDSLDGDLAQYDPATDTIYVTKEGLSSGTILHEIVHAGTVKVINEYLYGNKKSLSMSQLNAIKQLERIMEETRESLEPYHKAAYKDLFEFVSYALTSDQLQQDLHDEADVSRLQQAVYGGEKIKTILPEAKGQWSKFKLAIARILKVRDVYLRKSGELNKDVEANYVMEINAAFEDILAKPTEPIFLPALPAKAETTKENLQAEEYNVTNGLDEDSTFHKLSNKENPTSRVGAVKRMLTTREGWRTIVKNVQDKSYFARSLHNKLDRAGLINRDMSSNFNNFDEQGDLGVGEARQFVTEYLQEPYDALRQTVQDYMSMTGKKIDKVLPVLHQLAEAFHAGERRHVKWVVSVPLSTKQNLTHNGKQISAAQRRIDILGDARTGKPGLVHKVELSKQQQQNLWAELEYLANKHADPLGDSPRIDEKMAAKATKVDPKTGKSTYKGVDIKESAPEYNALGIDQAEIDKRMADLKAMPLEQQNLIKKMFDQAKTISDHTAELNKIGNYWSYPVSNLVGMYNYQHYMPFKGLSKHTLADELIEFDSKAHGKELQDVEHSAEGRFSTSDNPFLQLMTEGYKAANRAGRRNYTQSIKNAVGANKLNPTGTGVIKHAEVVKHIPFAERSVTDLSSFKGGPYIFHYNRDGSTDIIKIAEPKILNALRYTFRDASPMLDMANAVTGFFGAQHTRFNYDFAPMNFVRDMFTNAWNIGMSRQLGPAKAASYVKNIAYQVTKNGLGKAMEVALLHEKGDAASMKILSDLAERDPFARDMLEYIRFGGKTTYMEGFSLKSNLEQLNKGLGRNRILTKWDDFSKFIDCWNNMFEFTGRTAAYSMYKQEALKRNIAKGMSTAKGPQGQMSPAERAAAVEASAWTKNLANFEKVGEYGRELGSAYMFIRPSATGAVRAIEAVMPAFTKESWEIADLPPQIASNPAAAQEYIEAFRKDRRNAQVMIGTLMGMGYFAYWMASLMAPDDEWKRNSVKNDNMQQWTRFARFHIPDSVSTKVGMGKDVVVQVPWGFGAGAFAAAGAQIAGMSVGNASFKEGMGNIIGSIFADSFLPLPVSKMAPTDMPLAWAFDTIMPSVIRPIGEYLMNKNGIGQSINSAATRRLGDAYTGGDKIPELYKEAAKGIFNKTDGYFDWSPNTLYFFANSYADGVSRLGQTMYSWSNLEKGRKDFSPKTDLPLFGSFFGAKTNVDSREYGNMETRIKQMDQRIKTLDEVGPHGAATYDKNHPLDRAIVEVYRARQGELNKLRSEATKVRNSEGMSPRQRDAMVKIIIQEENLVKHEMVQDFKSYGMKP